MRFLVGDDNGFVKIVRIAAQHLRGDEAGPSQSQPEATILLRPKEGTTKASAIARVAVRRDDASEGPLVSCLLHTSHDRNEVLLFIILCTPSPSNASLQ
jgi:hypothetical protein